MNIWSYLSGAFKKGESQKILFFCGAGISQESGLSTFRDSDGLWLNHDVDDVCNIKTFGKNKKLVFDFYNEIKRQVLSVKPNAAHFSVSKIQKKYGVENVHIFTSNIDDLFERAGCLNVCHVHGDIFNMKCLSCEHEWNIGNELYDVSAKCPNCDGVEVKPSIVFFNEHAPKYKLMHQYFESSGVVIKNNIVENIKVVVGASFSVIGYNMIMPKRGKSIIVDRQDIGIPHFEKYIIKPATIGMLEVEETINGWYRK